MNEKEIIIDGVNVNRCYFLNKGITNLLCTCPSEIDEECKYNPNCYFKQLQRKTKECEKLITQRDTFMNLMNIYKDLSKGRKDSRQVTDYINELETKLNEYEQALNKIE